MSEPRRPASEEEQVQMTVAGITLDPTNNMPIVLLRDLAETVAIPIWIGLVEASAIATQLESIQLSRPMTHDLLKSVLQALGGNLKRVVVCDLRENTFYALLYLERDGRVLEVDARPSDALALALRTGSEIFVARKVIERSQVLDMEQVREVLSKPSLSRSANPAEQTRAEPGAAEQGEKPEQDRWSEILANLKPDDFGKYKM
ncbi:MAG TPA: bifunctional nuclease family protein [Myxococcota bacterium]|nr:bifunctional nuclease family protein [Myxococcota bacterium]HRY94004.1 bifunctional nuclease family protein [Myxococcota bacterium]HSA24640.1 bifunctional nuclease family protein [Myxococcota bacterium]